jgi:Sugar phosphate isomerases/epimerases
MKIAFSTLGCPGWSWDEIYATGKDLGFDGIEVRGIANEMFAPNAKPFSAANLAATKERFKGNIKLSMLTTGACVGVPELVEAAVKEAKSYIDLAEKLEVRYVRIMISPEPGPTEADFNLAVKTYRDICLYGKEKKVTPLIETNGILANSKKMAEFMESVNEENSGVLWDINHPIRYFHESVSDTFEKLSSYIKYVHVKDSIAKDGKVIYRMMGYGDLPVYDVVSLLHKSGYDSYVSLEWVKRWNPDLQEPGIVFSHFISYMTYLFSSVQNGK